MIYNCGEQLRLVHLRSRGASVPPAGKQRGRGNHPFLHHLWWEVSQQPPLLPDRHEEVARGSAGSRPQAAKLHRKVARQRLDFHHRVALKLVRERDVIAHEVPNVGGMGRGNLACSLHDGGWSQFCQLLAFKAACAGKRVEAVDPRYTSQRCHACGHTEKANRVSQARFGCRNCRHTANADHRAALNILALAEPSPLNKGGYAIRAARIPLPKQGECQNWPITRADAVHSDAVHHAPRGRRGRRAPTWDTRGRPRPFTVADRSDSAPSAESISLHSALLRQRCPYGPRLPPSGASAHRIGPAGAD
ncbi:RNA-guided endonuclease InsQ/TnpB family protein [Deinococcus hopiensis]|uniref:RNA-guided endonuclease InsQ/TnpB family protein n=1 Tax=Deinococcus hopiensis TaxID=309885 RepID=UPI001FEA4BEF|nr:RNA-guided endonuclease TnpB family protein [Deinococcus hopiensis]